MQNKDCNRYKFGFIGCGNMGGALISAVAKSLQAGEIAACDHNAEKLKKMQEYGAVPLPIEQLAARADFVVLGVKPQAMQATLAPITPILRSRTNLTVITMAAGLSIAGLRKLLGDTKGEIPVIRIMPNTPVKVGEGMILYSTDSVSEDNEKIFLHAFEKTGKLERIPESQIDAGSALSGCGPAFVYAFAEALIQGAKECGLPEPQAEKYAAQTIKGAAEMLLSYGDPAALRKAVCSPNGTTLAGIAALDAGGFKELAAKAVTAAYARTLELKS